MIFGLNVVGEANETGVINNSSFSSTKTSFSEIKIHGQNQKLKADNMWLRDSEFYNIADMANPSIYDNNTKLLCHFNNLFPATPIANLQAGKLQDQPIHPVLELE